MQVIDYTPQRYEALRQFVARTGMRLSLAHRPFVDYYYRAGDSCRLYLFLENDETIAATFGVERMRFEHRGQELMVGFGSNFYSLRPGVGGILFIRWLSSSAIGLVYGGSPDTHKLIRSRRWIYYTGVREYVLNDPFEPRPGERWWRIAARAVLRRIRRAKLSEYARRIPAEIRNRLSVREEQAYSQDLMPRESPFTFRFAPTLDHLNWRYNLRLSFVRYRLFRILDGGHTAGYVVINDSPERLMVAHCDGTERRTLAYGVLLSVLQAGCEDREPRTVLVASTHPAMRQIYERFGFRPKPSDRDFALGTLQGPAEVEPDTSNWLISFDWGDNGLRPPFLDQAAGEPERFPRL